LGLSKDIPTSDSQTATLAPSNAADSDSATFLKPTVTDSSSTTRSLVNLNLVHTDTLDAVLETVDEDETLDEEETLSEVFQILDNMKNGRINDSEIPFQLEGLLSANLPVSAEDVTVAFDMDEVFIEEDDY
jgi:hypothetical protein